MIRQKAFDALIDWGLHLLQQPILFFKIREQSLWQIGALFRFFVDHKIGSRHLHVDELAKHLR
jgi:hypothetical protein